MSRILHSRHLEYMLMSVVAPLVCIGMIWMLDIHVIDLKSPGVTTLDLLFTSAFLCLPLWLILTIAAITQTPGYSKYALHLIILPAVTITVNCFLDNPYRMELTAFIGSIVLTWIGSLVFCAVDWYNFNHQEFKLTQGKLR